MPDFIQDRIAQYDLLNAKAELPSNPLLLEASLLGGGIKDGFVARRDQALANPGLTTLEFVGTAAIGAGLTIAHRAGGRWGIAADLAATGFTCLAIGDAARRLAPTAYAMNDTYMNPKNYSENRALVANNLGTACLDYPLMAAGGFIGAKAVDLVPNSFSSIAGRYSGQDERRAAEWLKAAVKEPINMDNTPVVKPLDTTPVDLTRSYRASGILEKTASALGNSELGTPLCDRAAVLAGLEAASKNGQRPWRGIEKPPTAIEIPDLPAPLCDRAAVLAALDKLKLDKGLNGTAFSGAAASDNVNPFFNPKAVTYGTTELFPESAYLPDDASLHEIPHATMESFRPYNKESFDNLRDALWERRSEW